MTPLRQRPSMRLFILAILVIGTVRFALTLSGFPNTFVKYVSMTAIMVGGLLYYAVVTQSHKERLKASYLLVLPYMIVEVAALGYVWASRNPTIFHAPEYSFGLPVEYHWLGHLVGGVTWQ